MALYHVSDQSYVVGEVLRSRTSLSPFMAAQQQGPLARVEAILEVARPNSAPNRSYAYFAHESLADSGEYVRGEQTRSRLVMPRYYRVRLVEPHRAPMYLATAIAKCDDAARAARVAQEYWGPSLPWRYWEVLGTSMEVLDIVEPPDEAELLGAHVRLASDVTTATRIK